MPLDHDAQRARLDARGLTRGCPVCRHEVWNSCYHDGQDISAVEMPKADILPPTHRVEIDRVLADTRDGREEIVALVQEAFEDPQCDGIDIL